MMLGLAAIRELADKSEVTLNGKCYKVKNMVFATDNSSALKARIVLEEPASPNDVDIEVSVAVYHR